MVATGKGGAVAPNGVTAEILGTYGYFGPSIGLTFTYYSSLSSDWIYGKANINWYDNNYGSNYRYYFNDPADTMIIHIGGYNDPGRL